MQGARKESNNRTSERVQEERIRRRDPNGVMVPPIDQLPKHIKNGGPMRERSLSKGKVAQKNNH